LIDRLGAAISSAVTHRVHRPVHVPAPRTHGVGPVVAPVVAAGAAVTVAAAAELGGTSKGAFAGALVLLAAAILAETFPVPIRGVAAGATSLATIFLVAAAALYSWQLATLVGVLTMVLAEGRSRKRPVQLVYNSALYGLAAAAAGAAALAVTERPAGTLAGAAAFYATDIVLVALVIARTKQTPYGRVLASFVRSTLTPFLVMATTTAILVELWGDSPGLAALVAPPLIAIAVYQRRLHAAIERQRELDRLKEEFVAVVSHELRTPLASVYGGVQTLQRSSLAPDARERVLEVVRHEAARLAKLVDDVLWASRLDAPLRAGKPRTLVPAELVEEVVAAAAELAPENVTVTAAADGAVPRAAGEQEQVRRVLANLVENAVKYSPDGGSVSVGTCLAGNRVRFVVADEGIGVPEAERERIFEKFTRLDPQMVRGIGGTGLGLYICRKLVEGMGGRIWVEANEPAGSRFAFELPVAPPASEGGKPE
jgi:signal transduction histidine kinase